jgi:hypothetical protein
VSANNASSRKSAHLIGWFKSNVKYPPIRSLDSMLTFTTNWHRFICTTGPMYFFVRHYQNLRIFSLWKKAQFTHERVEYNVFLFDELLKGSKSLKIFQISLTFRFDKLWHLSKSVHTGEISHILTVSNKKIYFILRIFVSQMSSSFNKGRFWLELCIK